MEPSNERLYGKKSTILSSEAVGEGFSLTTKVYQGYCNDLDMMHFTFITSLDKLDEQHIGHCQFSVYRKKKNRPDASYQDILWSMDAFSQEALELAEALYNYSPYTLEATFNTTGIVFADVAWLREDYRGKGYFEPMFASAIRATRQRALTTPFMYYLKVFPLQFLNSEPKSKAEYERCKNKLKELYEQRIAAKKLTIKKGFGLYMAADYNHPPLMSAVFPQ